jgi:drug/metabolite transporter (DMT)-like permease
MPVGPCSSCCGWWLRARNGRVSRTQWLHLAVTGMLMHGGYLGGVWAAVKRRLGAGTAALIVGLQPLLTALWMSRHGPSTASGRASGWA